MDTTEVVITEDGEVIEYALKIPKKALAMLEYAARAYGWQRQIPDGHGGVKENPATALQAVLAYSIQNAKANAINMAASEEAEKARKMKAEEMETVVNEWLQLLTN